MTNTAYLKREIDALASAGQTERADELRARLAELATEARDQAEQAAVQDFVRWYSADVRSRAGRILKATKRLSDERGRIKASLLRQRKPALFQDLISFGKAIKAISEGVPGALLSVERERISLEELDLETDAEV